MEYDIQMTCKIDSTMKFLPRLCMALALVACLSLPAVAAIQAGVATLDITPKESIWLGGYAARTKPSQGVRQRIFAKALALRDENGATAVLVTADILGFTQEVVSSVAQKAESRFQVPRRLLLFNASHTHSAPVIGGALGPAYPLTDADRAVISRYTAWLGGELVELVGRSIGNLQPAQLSFGQGLAGLAVNRRRVGNPEYPNVTDPDLPVLIVRGGNGAIRAIVFGYACHNTTLDDYLVSGDWAGYAQSAVESQFAGAVALFVQNCGADANPLPRRTEELAIEHGRVIAAAVAEVVQGKPRKIDGAIAAAFREIDLPLEAAPPRQEWEERAASGSGMEQRHARLMLQQLDRDGRLPASHRWQAQAWRIGPEFTLLALGGEVVADYALRFKRQYGFRNLWVAGYSNDVFAYIPSRRVWQEGGYEGGEAMAAYGLPARFQESVEDLVVGTVDELMTALSNR
jgi:Flp pilus assembly pilin Flp